jgi:hypothetical protein
LAALVRATYPTCAFPGCGQPSYRCDLDHVIRWTDGGQTSEANLIPLCRRHHRAKDEAGWGVDRRPDGSCEWTSPAGRTYHVEASRYVDEAGEAEAGGDSTMSEDWTVDLTLPRLPTSRRATSTAGRPMAAAAPAELSTEPPPF